MNNNLMSFWTLLDRYKIVIPLYQRDYAQGREGQEELRCKFVTRLLDALRNPEERKVKLDYVFGVVANSDFNPLDGQQRLTTLWLLHWYVFQRAQIDDAAVMNRLKRFSYETRSTSAEFCEHLATTKGMVDQDNIVEFIKNQSWYLSRYEKDPTVCGMLNTLETIEVVSKSEKSDGFVAFWKVLIDSDCSISFFIKEQDNDAGAEDLYLKMNSRGKKLTQFENFKADLIGCKGEDKKEIFQPKDAGLMDNEWTDIFWAHKTDEGEIDDIYFQFFKRYLLAYWITEKCATEKVDDIIHKDKTKPDNLFSHLHQGSGKYVSIEPYKPSIDAELVERLERFFTAYGKFGSEKIDDIVAPYWFPACRDYTLIPRYDDKDEKNLDNVFHNKLYEGLPAFYAACRFLEKYCEGGDLREKEFKLWMRFVWNLVDGSFAGNPDVMVALLRLIKKITDGDFCDIDQMLVDDWKKSKNHPSSGIYAELFHDAPIAARTRALHGEIQKARLRVFQKEQKAEGKEVFEWSEKISSAETIGFLHGALEFLLPESLVDKYICESDDRKQIEGDVVVQIKHMGDYFAAEGVVPKIQKSLAKAIIKGMDHFWALDGNERKEYGISGEVADGLYDNEYLCRTDKKALRERIFRNPVTARALANALKAEDLDSVKTADFLDVGESQAEAAIRKGLIDSGILDIEGVVGRGDRSSWRFRGYKEELISFYRASGPGCRTESPRYYLDADPISDFLGCRRNEILFQSDAFVVEKNDRVADKCICAPKDRWGVHFTFNNNKFVWGRDNKISLIGADGKEKAASKYESTTHSSLEAFKKLLEGIAKDVPNE